MRKYLGAVALVMLFLTALSWGKKEETIEQLLERARTARPDQAADLYVEAAERQMNTLVTSFKAERWEEFRSELAKVVEFCDSSQKAAIQSKKRVKRTEIKIRQISHRLRGMKLDVDADDQPAVQTAVDQLEHFRAELLKSMFDLKDHSHD
jgi:hypothetical protein